MALPQTLHVALIVCDPPVHVCPVEVPWRRQPTRPSAHACSEVQEQLRSLLRWQGVCGSLDLGQRAHPDRRISPHGARSSRPCGAIQLATQRLPVRGDPALHRAGVHPGRGRWYIAPAVPDRRRFARDAQRPQATLRHDSWAWMSWAHDPPPRGLCEQNQPLPQSRTTAR
jgi:hypothetical protein